MSKLTKRNYGDVVPLPVPNKKVREQISALIDKVQADCASGALEEAGGGEEPLTHHFAPGVYCREYHIKKGDMVIGKIHKTCHLSIISQGEVTVKSQYGDEHLIAPCIFKSPIGIQRVVYAHEDTIWTTIHAVDTTDVDEIEDKVVTTSYDDIDEILALESGEES